MKLTWALILSVLVAACSTLESEPGEPPAPTEPSTQAASISTPVEALVLDDLGPAPELENATWLNVDRPLRLADLRGRVVLLDMWTFG